MIGVGIELLALVRVDRTEGAIFIMQHVDFLLSSPLKTSQYPVDPIVRNGPN
jgi:hypothetical protein